MKREKHSVSGKIVSVVKVFSNCKQFPMKLDKPENSLALNSTDSDTALEMIFIKFKL